MTRTDPRTTDGLPVEVTSLVGRRAETTEVKRLLARSRLVTLTGPGGVGKTRLATHVARTVRGVFDDGVRIVPLAELSQPDLLVPTVTSRLGLRVATGVDELVEEIGHRRLLLVLDNCEHLIDATAELATELLSGCPNLKVLATSRASLRVAGEALYAVPPLAVPGPGEPVPSGVALTYDGVALFLERAGMLNSDVASGKVDEQAVVELCQRLDGLPLAIELAAAGSRWLSVETMLARAADPLAEGPAVSRSAPGRHRSLRASLAHSHELCTPASRTLWARFSVFRGGATLEAVEAVCAGGELSTDEVGTALFELVDKSVVVLEGSRYSMLETIRRYGAASLATAGDEDALRRAHLRYFASEADELRAGWFGPHQSLLLGRVLADQANVRAALEFTLHAPASVRTGLRMASALWTYWIGSGLPGEGRRWLSRLLAADEDPSRERAAALWSHGFLSAVDGDIPAARSLLAECLRTADELGDKANAAHALSTLGVADLFEGRIDDAVERLESGVAQERSVEGSTPYLVDALINLGLAHCYRGDLQRAQAVLEEATDLCVASGEELLLSWALVFRSLAALLGDRVEEAERLARESLTRKRELANQQGMVWAIELLAWTSLERGDTQRAALLLAAGEARSEDFGPAFHGFPGMREWHERYATKAREQLGTVLLSQAVGRGQQLSMDELVAVALGESRAGTMKPESALHDLPLTPRELEIAELVATGKTNREIADQLVIALRTVDTHVQHILTKLDFTSRSQVAALVAATQVPHS